MQSVLSARTALSSTPTPLPRRACQPVVYPCAKAHLPATPRWRARVNAQLVGGRGLAAAGSQWGVSMEAESHPRQGFGWGGRGEGDRQAGLVSMPPRSQSQPGGAGSPPLRRLGIGWRAWQGGHRQPCATTPRARLGHAGPLVHSSLQEAAGCVRASLQREGLDNPLARFPACIAPKCQTLCCNGAQFRRVQGA